MSNLRTTLWLRCLLGRSLAAFTLAFIRTRTGYDLRTCCKLLAPWQLVGQERSTKADEYAEEIHGGLKSDEGLLAWELQYRRKIGGIGVPACTPSKPQATRIPNCFQMVLAWHVTGSSQILSPHGWGCHTMLVCRVVGGLCRVVAGHSEAKRFSHVVWTFIMRDFARLSIEKLVEPCTSWWSVGAWRKL